MAAATTPPPSTVTFPLSEASPKNVHPVPHVRPPHLPFRRISLPTAPSLMHRESVISVASFDSLPEEGEPPGSSVPTVMRNVHPGRAGRGRPTSAESPRRRRRREMSVKPLDDARQAKRRKIIEEFYDTERAYLDGLELIYSHFLTPIISSLDTPNPLLDRSALTSVFSNFIDIWNLHRSFFSSLSSLLSKSETPIPTSASSSSHDALPLSAILLSHFPYLSLYNPFVTSFPSTMSSLANLISPPSANHPNSEYNPAFASFLLVQEADPRCGKLKLRDWLLTIVQRCPRYLLLLKDLIDCTDTEDPEHSRLTAVHTLVSKITLSLNSSLHTHAQTLALLSLQRSTPNLPFQLIVPGRTLLRRGPLLQLERSAQPREREFLLFSDCLVWLAGEEAERGWKGDWKIGRGGWNGGYGNGIGEPSTSSSNPVSRPPPMSRSRSKSEAELPMLKPRPGAPPVEPVSRPGSLSPSTPSTPSRATATRTGDAPAKKAYNNPPSNVIKRYASSGSAEERWVYKGRAELVDLEVVVSPPREPGEERRFEILSPESSFVLYAATELERDEWSAVIRQAKSQLLVSLNITHPNSTLTSSSSTNHLRRSLQALPFPPSDDRLATVHESPDARGGSKGKGSTELKERRGKVEHWVPAIWIPDEKTGACMRCGRTFGWRRRRHHCRLCGRCVCAQCSGCTFFITDPSSKENPSRPARACDACYETVFPVLYPSPEITEQDSNPRNGDTMTSLSNFPSWLSMPSLPVASSPQALMAIDREPIRNMADAAHEDIHGLGGRVRLKSHQSRPKSYHQILEDFEDQHQHQGRFDVVMDFPLEEGVSEGQEGEETFVAAESDREPPSTPNWPASLSSSPRKEDTARRSKRFSLPAVALQTTNVTARTQQRGFGDAAAAAAAPGDGPMKINKRFSLVLGGGRHPNAGGASSRNEMRAKLGGRAEQYDGKSKTELGKGVAAGKLSELLGRKVREARLGGE